MTLLQVVSLLHLLHFGRSIVGHWPETKWPKGTFGIPSTRSQGCPESSGFQFETGQRQWDCEDDDGLSKVSVSMHLAVMFDSEKDIGMTFCSKTDTLIAESSTGGPWPSGKYCLYRVGGTCPRGFQEGWIFWQDERNDNRNAVKGTLPDGVYIKGSTKMYFCCRTDGDPDIPVELPRSRNFALMRFGDTCQKVEGTQERNEWVIWDNDRRDRTGKGFAWDGVIPDEGVNELGDVRLQYCYYNKISYCGNPGIPEHGIVEGARYNEGSTLKFSCDEGYQRSGLELITCLSGERWNAEIPVCREVDPCHDGSNGGCEQSCTYTAPGERDCSCTIGYTLQGDGYSCLDVNECLDVEIAGQCEHKCVNERGGYRCECHEGYELTPDDRTCGDVNECEQDICNQKCENNEGSYRCSCFPGYELRGDPNTCYDINECLPAYSVCDQLCYNLDGSYGCGCISGWVLGNDNHTCRHKNPCNKENSPCEQGCERPFDEEEDSYRCTCTSGYVLNEDGKTCDDVDECITLGTNKCDHNCLNTYGSYDCWCNPGYISGVDGHSCQDLDECQCGATSGCGGCSQICVNTIGSHHCRCYADYVGLRPDLSECVVKYSEEDPCVINQCINNKNTVCFRDGYNNTRCDCKSGFFMNADKTECIQEQCDLHPCPKGSSCEERPTTRVCIPDNGKTEATSASDPSGSLMIIVITVAVVGVWFLIVGVVIIVVRRRRARKKPRNTRYTNVSGYPTIQSLPTNLPTNRGSSLMNNPIYHSTTLPSRDDQHEYEELDKLAQRSKKFASNSYDQGMNGLLDYEDGEPYSYAVTPGPPGGALGLPPPPSHILPPPVPQNTQPEYV